jgi:3-oxoacyl-[acyl-carrier-protein] synthase III
MPMIISPFVLNTIITGTGSCVPEVNVSNEQFLQNTFYTKEGTPEIKKTELLVKKFYERTGIRSRRYARNDQVASDLGTEAVAYALAAAHRKVNELDMIIGATNFGDVQAPSYASDFVPSLATRVLKKLGHTGNGITALDVIAGCPGWLEATYTAHLHIQAGHARRVAVVAMETLSRISDPSDKDSMIYADGAGAVILEANEQYHRQGILSYASETVTQFKAVNSSITSCADFLTMGPANDPALPQNRLYLKMIGPNVAQLAIERVPDIIKKVAEIDGISLNDISLFLLHQANKKLDHDMALATGVLPGELEQKVPITIDWLGNSSVATIPTMLDLIMRERAFTNGHKYVFEPGKYLVFASVGASMNINAMIYRIPF